MKKVTVLFIIMLILLTLTPAFISAQNDDMPEVIEYVVTTATANIRSGPGTGYGIVGTVVAGESLLIYDETPETTGWLRIYRADEDDAYIADFLVERAPMRFYPPTQEPVVTVSGRGKTISDVLDFPSGAYRIDVTVQDNAFILKSIVISGDCRDRTIFNEINFDANRLVLSGLFVSSGCSVIFETDNVDGDWVLEVRDLLDANVILESLLEIEENTSIVGTGRTLTMLTLLPEGIWAVNAVVHDNAFILHAQMLEGDCDDGSVFNEIDFDVNILEISTVYRSDGCLIFWETSNVDGDWELSFTQLQ
ncbi:MAG: SH3 domain-containing protein [Anaerolineae bacterium]|nr:SH3 domain-containing protein [Anaerolineae bacterium]